MAIRKTRKELSDNFQSGKLPTQEAFEELIVSTVNIKEDGFEKTSDFGMKLAQLGNNKLMSFYNEITLRDPIWTMAFSVPTNMKKDGNNGTNEKNLNFFYGNSTQNGLTLASAPENKDDGEHTVQGKIRVGINKADPAHELDVNGFIASGGRLGRGPFAVDADGEEHPIAIHLDGCRAFEVVAGVGKNGTRNWALLHAFAISTFNSKHSSITYHQAYYASRCDQIKLAWRGDANDYKLTIKTRCNLGNEMQIRYFITDLWPDYFMENLPKPGRDETIPPDEK